MDNYVDAAEVASLPPGKGRTVEVKGQKLALFNVGGTFYAIENACPHRAGPLGAGYVEGNEVYCPLHGWAFDLRSGACPTRPDRPVKTFPTRVADGKVWVAVD